jgi:apolipoprotein N-acyltransferase
MDAAYAIGQIVGRIIMSYLIVWIVCVLFSRFNWRLAFRRSLRPYAWAAVMILTMLGIGGHIVINGGL